MSDYIQISHISIYWNPILAIVMLVWLVFWYWRRRVHSSKYTIPSYKINHIKKRVYNISITLILITSILIPLDIKTPLDNISRVIDLSPSISESQANIDRINDTYRSVYSIGKKHTITLVAGLPYDYCKNCKVSALDRLTVDQNLFTGDIYGSAMWDWLLIAHDSQGDYKYNNVKIIGITDSGTNKWIDLNKAISYIWKDKVLVLMHDDDLSSNINKVKQFLKMNELNSILWPVWVGSHLILLFLYILSIWKLKHSYDTL